VGLAGGSVYVYNTDGTHIPGLELGFTAYPYASDVVVAAADFDGDGKDEIIVGEGNKSGDSAYVRILAYNGGLIEDTGVNLLAYQKKKGLSVATGDVNGDGVPELITTDGAKNKRTVEVRIWSIDTSAGAGAWAAVDAGGFIDGYTNSYADLALGDINADGTDEVLISVFESNASSVTILGFSADGTKVLEFVVPVVGNSIEIAAGDINFDGTAEIMIGDGSSDPNSSVILIYNADGTYRGEFPAFDNADVSGAKVSVGQLMGQ
jgi:hypothetical protein